MSLLEDIFLQDEAGEAEELERVIEGDDDEQIRPLDNSDDNSEKEDEAEEDKRRVDPTAKEKRVIKNPRFVLNPARLTGPRGIQIIPEHFKDFKFKGKGHEKEDLDIVLKKLEHWAYRLYPKFQFEDCLKKIETLGKKRPVMVHLHKIRTDQFMSEETVAQKDSSDDEAPVVQEEDEFDKLLQQQIDLARAAPAPAPGSLRKDFRSPAEVRSPITMPKATSSPSISSEQRERMLKNRQMAEERRLAKLKQTQTVTESNSTINSEAIVINDESNTEFVNSETTKAKKNRLQFIDSSDEECDITSVNQSISVVVHVPFTKNNHDSEIDNHKDSVTDNEFEKIDTEDSIVDTKENSNLDTNNDQDNDMDMKDSEIDATNRTENQDEELTDNIVTRETPEKNNSESIEPDEHINKHISINEKTDSETIKDITNTELIVEEIMNVDFSDDF